jgi:deoxyribodipyrimidine photo-lyase
LLDGDPASNNLSWQWVASTFSHKAYFFNRENLERYTGGRYCAGCALRNACPLEGSYEALEERLFPQVRVEDGVDVPVRSLRESARPGLQSRVGERPLVWVHTDALNPKAEVLTRFAGAPAVFVWDEEWLEGERISRKRVEFLEECLAEMPERMEVRRGEVAAEVLAAAQAQGADCVVAMRTVDPRFVGAARVIAEMLPVVWVEDPKFVEDRTGFDLKRFSRYWRKAQDSAMRPGAGGRTAPPA